MDEDDERREASIALTPSLRSDFRPSAGITSDQLSKFQAIPEGADAVIADGGEGTTHEVVNGFFFGGKPISNHDPKSTHSTALGLIPLGTGSDFARTFGWKNDPHDAI